MGKIELQVIRSMTIRELDDASNIHMQVALSPKTDLAVARRSLQRANALRTEMIIKKMAAITMRGALK